MTTGTTKPAQLVLLGATPGRLRAWIGPPALRRVDGSAQVWLYDTSACRLDVIFYPDAAGHPHVATAMPIPRGMSAASCLASLERERLEPERAS